MKMSPRKLSFIMLQVSLASIVFLAAFLFSGIVIRQVEQQEITQLRERVSERSVIIQSELSYEINASLNLVLGLIGFVNVVQNPTQAEFQQIAEVIIRKSEIIRNIGLAPGNVISYMHPLEGNEAAIGLDYMNTPAQKDAVVRAIELRKEVIAGPVNLVQGGEGLIARIPIFIEAADPPYWGMASIVVDKEKLFNAVDIETDSDWLDVAVKGKDGEGLEGGMVYGDEGVFFRDPVLTRLILPDGEWVIAASPVGGWENGRSFWSYPVLWFALLFALTITVLVMNLLATSRKMHFQALHDPLTRLANRRLFQMLIERQISFADRNRLSFYLLYFDLDNFKKINDLHGHKTGDAVLQKTAEAVKSSIRDTDIFARIGGDEFVLLPCQLDSRADVNMLCDKIIQIVNNISDELHLKIRIGCSIGVSSYPGDGRMIDELIKNADEAMYSSKRKGKNRASFYSE